MKGKGSEGEGREMAGKGMQGKATHTCKDKERQGRPSKDDTTTGQNKTRGRQEQVHLVNISKLEMA